MKAAIIALTPKGRLLQDKITEEFKTVNLPQAPSDEVEWDIYAPGTDLDQWLLVRFEICDAIIFITAAGIAVRKIAPLLSSKLTDPAVLVLDSAGEYVIPILSGHVGGGNAIAVQLAEAISAAAVITTATDTEGKFAWDVWAKKRGFGILDKAGIVHVSSALLRKEDIKLWISPGLKVLGELPKQSILTRSRIRADVVIASDYAEAVSAADTALRKNGADKKALPLILYPKRYIAGVGCKKDTPPSILEERFHSVLEKMHIPAEEIIAITTIDIKKEEKAVAELAHKYQIKLYAYDNKALAAVEGSFTKSAFVAETVGVDNVCERSAKKFADDNGEISHFILRKYAGEGTTLAIARRDMEVRFEEEK